MKIFVDVIDAKNSCYAGLLLVGDKEQIYYRNSFELKTKDKRDASILVISRAMSFIQHTQPLHCKDKLDIFNNFICKEDLEQNLYTKRFLVNNVYRLDESKIENRSYVNENYINEVKNLTRINYRQYYINEYLNRKSR